MNKINVVEFHTSELTTIKKPDTQISNYICGYINWHDNESLYDQWGEIVDINFCHVNVYNADIGGEIVEWINGIYNIWPNTQLRIRLLYNVIDFNDKVFQSIININNIEIETRYDNNNLLKKQITQFYTVNNTKYTTDYMDLVSDSKWNDAYNDIKGTDDWPKCDTPHDFKYLPDSIQHECRTNGLDSSEFIVNNSVTIFNTDNRITLMPRKSNDEYRYDDSISQTVTELNNNNIKPTNVYLAHYGCRQRKNAQFVNGKLYQCPVSVISTKTGNLTNTPNYDPLSLTHPIPERVKFLKHMTSIGNVIPQCQLCKPYKSLRVANRFIAAVIDYVRNRHGTSTQVIPVRLDHQCVFYKEIDNTARNVVIVMHDKFLHTSDDSQFGWYNKTPISETLYLLHKYCTDHPEQRFVLVTENFYVQDELSLLTPEISNLHIITSPHYYFQYDRGLETLQPLENKNPNTDKHVICLTGTPMDPRVITILYLIYSGVDKHTVMSMMAYERKKQIPIKHYYDNTYDLSLFYKTIKDHVLVKELKAIDDTLGDYPFMVEKNFKLGKNFITHLHKLYRESYIEIIQESTFMEPSAEISEKFIYSVYGKNFPIFIGTYRIVDVYRSLGFDVFDDIINHSYDDEPDPFLRIKKAIDLNYDLLCDRDKTIDLWGKNSHRFTENIKLFKEFYNKEIKKTTIMLNKILIQK
jgi:hypothetical protein